MLHTVYILTIQYCGLLKADVAILQGVCDHLTMAIELSLQLQQVNEKLIDRKKNR